MVNHTAVDVLLITIFHLIIPSNGLKLPDSYPKTVVGDDKALAQSLTHLIQNSRKYPDLGFPNWNSFMRPHLYMLHSTQLTSLLTAQIYWSNITTYGIDEAILQEVRGFQPDQPVTSIHFKLLLPKFRLHLNTNEDLKIVLLSVKPRGNVIINAENVEVSILLKTDTVQRNGHDYLIIRDSSVKIHVGQFEIKFKYQNVDSIIAKMVGGVVNSNWKAVKSMMDPTFNRFIADTIQKSVLQPMFDKNSLRELFSEMFHLNSERHSLAMKTPQDKCIK